MAERRPFWRELHWQVLVAMAAGLAVGAAFPDAGRAVGILGDLFLRLLKMIIVPLIFFSLASGVASLGDLRAAGRIGGRTLVYYLCTTAVAITIGLVLVNVIRPGVGRELPLGEAPQFAGAQGLSLADLLEKLVPDNPVAAMSESRYLQVIVFAIAVGAFLTLLEGRHRESWQDLVDGGFELFMAMTGAVIRLAPIGVLALVARTVAEAGLAVLGPLGMYMLTLALALAVHALVVLPLVLYLVGGRRPGPYATAFLPALLTAFSTASSNATLPLTMECAEERAGIPNRVASFVLPLGATVNMDGTALYEAVAVVFIAQAYGVHLGLGQQLTILLTALLASVGAAGIPMAGLVMMAIVLRSVGLPLEGIGLIVGVDRILDMARTAVNVWGDSVGCAVIARLERDVPREA